MDGSVGPDAAGSDAALIACGGCPRHRIENVCKSSEQVGDDCLPTQGVSVSWLLRSREIYDSVTTVQVLPTRREWGMRDRASCLRTSVLLESSPGIWVLHGNLEPGTCWALATQAPAHWR